MHRARFIGFLPNFTAMLNHTTGAKWACTLSLFQNLYESTCLLYIKANTIPVKKREHGFVL